MEERVHCLLVSSGFAVAPFHPNWGHTQSRTAGSPHSLSHPCEQPTCPVLAVPQLSLAGFPSAHGT